MPSSALTAAEEFAAALANATEPGKCTTRRGEIVYVDMTDFEY